MSRSEKIPVVLLVEDDPDTSELYQAALTMEGFRVVRATNGVRALAMAARERPDVVVTDLAMPLMDGFALSQSLRSRQGTRHIPIIAVSGQASFEPRTRSLRHAFDLILTKPCLPHTLIDAIDSLLEAYEGRSVRRRNRSGSDEGDEDIDDERSIAACAARPRQA